MSDRPTRVFALRPLEKADLAVVAHWFQDVEDLACFDRTSRVPLNLPNSESTWESALGVMTDSGKCWFVVESEANQVVGIVGLEGMSSVNRDAVIALFTDKSVRRHGIGIRATALVLDFAFRQLGLKRVTSYYRADNESTGGLIAQVGFEIEGRMRQAWFAEGQYFDMIVVGVLRDEWAARRDALARELSSETIVAFGGTALSSWAWPPRSPGTT